jgi:tetratricopeptide (TPR) repeat protein
LIEALQSIQGAAAEPTQGLGDVRDRVVTALARAVDRRVANFEGAGDAPSYQAYESYVAGLHAYLSGDFAKARPHFERAFALDSTFLRALMWQGASAAFSGGHGEAVAAFNTLTARASELSPYDRHHLEFFKAAITYDNERAYSEALAMTNASPGSDDAARELALSALRSGRIQESISRFERLDRESGISHDWPEYFFVLTAAYDAKGDLDGALEVARSSKVHDPWALAALGWAAAARGNTALALAMVDTVVQQTPEAAPLYRLATRLYGAGQRADAVRLWRRAGAAPARSFYSALSLYYAGEYAHAAAAADSLEVGQEPTGRLAGLRGLLAARRGNEAYARAVLDTLRREAPMASRRWQARLHAVLGEKDAAAQLLSNLIFDQNLQILTRYDPDLMPLSGYPPFEQALRLRR